MDLKFPVKQRAKYGINVLPDGTQKKELIGYEMWATDFAIREKIDRILLDPKSPWRQLWAEAFKQQYYGSNLDLDSYELDAIWDESIGGWEGFTTSFIWQNIKFVDVYVQIVVGQKYFLPKILIKQIKDKLNAKISKIDASEIFASEENLSIEWAKPNEKDKKYFHNPQLDYFGKIKR